MTYEQLSTIFKPSILLTAYFGGLSDNFEFVGIRFASMLKKECFSFESIPNKIVVRLLPSEIHFVLKEIRPLVGGESHKIQYPGLSVLEGVLLIKQYWSEIKVEEITIVRRFHEAERIFSKMQHGMTFFYYQFIFKTGNLKQVLSELKMMSDTAQNQHGQTAF